MFGRMPHAVALVCGLTLAFSVFPAARSVHAASRIVTKTADTNDGACDADCSLREAVAAASSGDTITFTGALAGQTITLSSTVTITGDLTIDGSSLGSHVAISGNSAVRVLDIASLFINVGLIDLDIVDGYGSNGAGVFNNGDLTIANCTLSGNDTGVGGFGGAIYTTSPGSLNVRSSTFAGNQSGGSGGAIYANGGILGIANSTFTGNTSSAGVVMAAAATTATITNSTFSGNAGTQDGVAVYNGGTLHLGNTILADSTGGADCKNAAGGTVASDVNNLIEANAPGPFNCGAPALAADPLLGALGDNGGPTRTLALLPGSPAVDGGDDATCADAGTVNDLDQRGVPRTRDAHCDIGAYERSVRHVDPTGSDAANDCTDSGAPCATIVHAIQQASSGDRITIGAGTHDASAGIAVQEHLEFSGAGMDQTVLDGDHAGRVVGVWPEKVVSFADLTIQNGAAPFGGSGGVVNSGNLTLTRVRIAGNSTPDGGGGIESNGSLTVVDSTISGNHAGSVGGGIYISGGPSSTLLNRVTISGNTTDGSSGGIHVQGASSLDLVNVTISGNTAASGGGGMTSTVTTDLTILSSTIAGNHVPAGGDGGMVSYGAVSIGNSVVAGNDGDQCLSAGSWTSQGHNLSSDAMCLFTQAGDQEDADALLGPLADNGGATQTHALLAGSPAIDAGDNALCADAATVNNVDQRGRPRPDDGDLDATATCDIGAFEFQRAPLTATLGPQAKSDGWVRESSEASRKGGSKNNRGRVILVGDDDANRQYRGILSFDTSGIPAGAVITGASLKVRKAGLVGSNPFRSHRGLWIDIRNPSFGSKPTLQASDFQASAGMNLAGRFASKPVSRWYSADLDSAAYALLEPTGTIQFRLRFRKDDNNDFGADYLRLSSGNAPAASRPQLIVEYYVP